MSLWGSSDMMITLCLKHVVFWFAVYMHKYRILFKITCFLGACVMFSGCASLNIEKKRILFSPYQVTVQQGNFIPASMTYDQLHRGMSKQDVCALFGSPLLQDMFHPDRWDYIFYVTQGNKRIIEKQHLVMSFQDNKLYEWSVSGNFLNENNMYKILKK